MLPINRMLHAPARGGVIVQHLTLRRARSARPHNRVADSAHSHAVAAERLGKVEFKVDCNAAAQAEFNRAMALYHSFWWPAASKAFEAVAQADPTCGMAHWGRAMVILDNPFTWPANLRTKLKDVSARSTPPARRDSGVSARRTMSRQWRRSCATTRRWTIARDCRPTTMRWRKLARRYPDDKEAAILSALVTSANFNPTDKTYANQLKAAKASSDPQPPIPTTRGRALS